MTRLLTPAVLAALIAGIAAGTPARGADPAKVQAALKKGVEFLKTHRPGGGGGEGVGTGNGLGLSALVGLALLEGGVKPADPSLNAIVQFVRTGSYREIQTYSVALAIIFLDRLNDPTDQPLTQLLGTRLLAGQTAGGGWAYATWTDVNAADETRLRNAMMPKNVAVVNQAAPPDPASTAPPPKMHAEAAAVYARVKGGYRVTTAGGDDNSNTQFALVGLWVAQRRGVPCGNAFRQVETRFLRNQSPNDHGWAYGHGGDGGASSSTPSMTCAGLIGLACAAAAKDDPKPTAEKEKKADEDPFFNPPDGNAGGADPDVVPAAPPPEKRASAARDAAIARGLTAIGRLIKGNAGMGAGGDGGWGGVSDLYFIWSLERVGVAFGLDTIGDVDWYGWGVDRILPGQADDGSWKGSYQMHAVTSFAVLFLAKSNFVADLSNKIKGKIKDPGAAELRGSRGGILGLNAAGSREAVRAPGSGGGAAGGTDTPGIAAVQGPTPGELVGDDLVRATDADWVTKLKIAKDSKGGKYTDGLVKAIAFLDGKRLYQARETLAERLTRMTPETLKRMLADRDPELRRAAALACGMRDDKAHVRDLIDRTIDLDESVIRAAKASLRSLTEQTLGPPPGATDEEKAKARDAWLQWFTLEGRGK